jgi:tetratricopeptide (TPR) repeat protein
LLLFLPWCTCEDKIRYPDLKPNRSNFIHLYGSAEDSVEQTVRIRIYFPAVTKILVPAPGLRKMKLPILLLFLALPAPPSSGENLQDAIRLYEKGKFAQATESFQKLSVSNPANPEIWVWLSKSRLKIRDWDRAVQAMEKAVQLHPENAEYRLLLGRACGSRASHSSFLTAMSWARRVVREFEAARNLAPENIDVRFDLLEYYLNAPGIVGGGKDKAYAEAEVITKLNPRMGHVARATIHIKNKKWDVAQKELTQAVTENPESASANKDLAGFLFDRQDFEGALKYAQKAILLDGNSKRSKLIAAGAKIRLHSDLEAAGETLRDFLAGSLGDGDPGFQEVYYWLGEYYLEKGERSRAQEAFKTALSFDPEYSRAKEGLSKSK